MQSCQSSEGGRRRRRKDTKTVRDRFKKKKENLSIANVYKKGHFLWPIQSYILQHNRCFVLTDSLFHIHSTSQIKQGNQEHKHTFFSEWSVQWEISSQEAIKVKILHIKIAINILNV